MKPYRNPNIVSIEEALKIINAYVPPKKKIPVEPIEQKNPIISDGEYITLENMACVDADGNVFESYERLDVARDIFRSGNAQVSRTPYTHAVHCKEMGLFLPSFALTCNIVARLYERRSDAKIERVLQQYKDKGNGFGWHAQNTIIDFGSSKVIHYPSGSDFNQKDPINSSQPRTILPFVKDSLEDALLKDALRDASSRRFLQQLTGLHEPEILIEIGKYFGKPAKVWFPWNGKAGKGFKEKRAAWFGCDGTFFDLDAGIFLSIAYTARGVRRRGGERSEPGAGGAK